MKVVLKILGGSFAVFLVLAMVEEREAFVPLFARLWGGGAAAEAPPAVPEEDRQAAVDTIRELLSLWNHLEESGGDPRFVERLPASPEVVDEMMAEIAYLRHNYRRQDQKLMKLDVVRADAAGPRRLSLTAREYWVVRSSNVHHRQEASPPRSIVVNVRYLLERDDGHWRVVQWIHVPEPPRQEADR